MRTKQLATVVLALSACRDTPSPPQHPQAAGPPGAASRTDPPGRPYDDAELARYLAARAECMEQAAGVNIEVFVLDDPDIGAWALAGQQVAITRGLLLQLRSEAELEALLAHELAHHELGHVRPATDRPQRDPSLLEIPSLLLGAVRSAAHSRAQERVADERGIELLAACGRSPVAMAELFAVLEALDGKENSRFFATHPPLETRRHDALSRTAERTKDTRKDAYMNAIDGVVYGEDPRAGFVDQGHFHVPSLDLSASIPDGWTHRVEDGVLMIQTDEQRTLAILAPAEARDPRELIQGFIDIPELLSDGVASSFVGEWSVTRASFTAGDKAGVVAYLQRNEVSLLLFGVTAYARWEPFSEALTELLVGLRRFEDEGLSPVAPRRVRMLVLDRPSTLTEVSQRPDCDMTPTDLARLNTIDLATPLPAGTRLKIASDSHPRQQTAR